MCKAASPVLNLFVVVFELLQTLLNLIEILFTEIVLAQVNVVNHLGKVHEESFGKLNEHGRAVQHAQMQERLADSSGLVQAPTMLFIQLLVTFCF
jgi:hypothetical protein